MKRTIILDEYEQDIEDNFHKHVIPSDMQSSMVILKQAAKAHGKQKKSITIRIHEIELEAIKIKASKIGIPYQTYINMLIHRDTTSME